jgi:nitrite reductase/ring-hydroxylating ferredoxin subunit/uncharacterized membrane protein
MILNRLLDKVADTIERTEALDKPSEALAAVWNKVLSPQPVVEVLSGTPIGHPLHPLLVTVPIGAWSSALVFDLVGDEDGARRLTGLGVLAAAPTAIAGWSDWRYTTGGERRVGLVHAVSNGAAVAAYGASWLARRRGNKVSGIVWSAVGGSLLGFGGWLGGHLSYALGVGVDTTAFQHAADDWTEVLPADQVQAGSLTGADVAGVPLVLTRDPGGRVVALADRCTHRGAPLHEGELSDGCIVCPWHSSAFELDGGVARGPAQRPQAAYEVEERDGRIWVRRADETHGLRTNPVGV